MGRMAGQLVGGQLIEGQLMGGQLVVLILLVGARSLHSAGDTGLMYAFRRAPTFISTAKPLLQD